MEWLKNNFEIVVFIALLLILVLGIITVIYNFVFNKNFVNKKIKLNCFLEIDNETGEMVYSFNVINRGFNDTVITALGFKYASKSIDYFNACDFLKNTKEAKVVVPQRDSIKVSIEKENLEKLILKINTYNKIKKIKCYIIDSIGNITTANAKDAYKQVSTTFNELMQKEEKRIKEKILDEKKKNKAEKEEQKRVKAYMKAKEKNVKKIKSEIVEDDENISKKAIDDNKRAIKEKIEEEKKNNADEKIISEDTKDEK